MPAVATTRPTPALPAPWGLRRVGARPAVGSLPAWLALAEAVHGAAPSLTVMVLDAAVAGVVAWTVHGVRRGGTQAATVFVVAAILCGLYRHRSRTETVGGAWYALRVLPPVAVLAAIAWVAPPVVSGRPVVAMSLASAAAVGAALVSVRAALWPLVRWARRDCGLGLRPALVVGGEADSARVVRLLGAHPEWGLAAVAVYRPHPDDAQLDGPAAATVGPLLTRGEVAEVLVAPGPAGEAAMGACLSWARRGGPHHTLLLPRRRLAADPLRGRLGDLAALRLTDLHDLRRRRPAKRVLDVAGALFLLGLLAPVAAAVALAVRLEDGHPVVYRQARVGRGGRLFTIFKFRSMVVGADELVGALAAGNACTGLLFKLERDPRVSRVGAVIRRLAADELPQLVNVLRGEMSLVGPRPLPVDPATFSPAAARRHCVVPGLTGAWQVEGGNRLTYDEMVQLDLAYLAGWTVTRDLWLIARTPFALAARRGPC
ncbi:MAG TPA: sugar transferase [Acidimicrobiales bacterium]|nr:sugar transferase [Acidimicrobiales bacterium]